MRARSLKPGIFENEILGVADPIYTLLFTGLWCCADKAGRLEDRPLKIRGQVFRFKNGLDIEPLLAWLTEKKFIVRYEAMGEKYIQIINFEKHQHPHHTEKKSTITPYIGAVTGREPLSTGDTPSESGLLTPDSGIMNHESGLLKQEKDGFKTVTEPKKSEAEFRSRNLKADFRKTLAGLKA